MLVGLADVKVKETRKRVRRVRTTAIFTVLMW